MRIINIAIVLVFLFSSTVWAALNPDLASPSIVINLPSRTLDLYSAGNLVKTYRVAVGKPSTPTPLGEFAVFEKEVNPAWYPPRTGEVVPSGPWNPLGYRWVGFYGLVGFHGTNTPWAIGLAVSNGCVRMYEEDVEELFEVVPYGTPVRVTYERIRLLVNSLGEVSLGIYPDIYGYRPLSVAEPMAKVADAGLAGFVSEEELAVLLREEADRQVPLARFQLIRVNGRLLPERAVAVHDTSYIPVLPVAAALAANLTWDEGAGLVRGDKRTVPAAMRGGQIYVTATDAHLLFGGQLQWQAEENTLALDVVSLFLNGRPLKADVQVVDGVLVVPLAAVAEAVGQKVNYGPDGAAMVQGSRVSCPLIGGEHYIQITRIYDVFKAYVYWNAAGRSIELTYPFKVSGGTD